MTRPTMPPDDPNSAASQSDSRLIDIRAARSQVESARLRQLRATPDLLLKSPSPAALPTKPPPGYQLLRELHRGGQGIVYLAIQISTGRHVAVKILHNRQHADSAAVELARFQREIAILSRLKHPNIVTVHDCGRSDEHVYLVMDYVEGRPLDVFADRDRPALRDLLSLFAQVCDGVNAAHLRGIVHRDLKPGNILVDEQRIPHVLDFGLAKPADDSAAFGHASDVTLTGQFVGSLPWSSPEQAEGRIDQLDIRTDVYSLGVVLYQLLTGRFPYPVTGRIDEIVRHIATTSPARPSSIARAIDRELDTILLKCLAKEPERRYQSAGDIARDLRRYLANQPIDARADSAWYVVCKQLRRHRAIVLAGSAFLALLIASSIVAWSLYATANTARTAEQARLWESLVDQARAARGDDRVGRRIDGLNAIRRAREIRFDRALRDEAVACLALPDLRCIRDFPEKNFTSARGTKSTTRFAHVTDAGQVEVRDTDSNALLASLDCAGLRVAAITFSPDGSLLAVKTIKQRETKLSFWNIASHTRIAEFDCPRQTFADVSFAADGRIALIRSLRSAIVLDPTATHPLANIATDFDIFSIAIDPAGRRLALIGGDATFVAIWDIAESRVTRRLKVAPTYAFCTTWSPDGATLAVGADDHNIYLFNPATDAPPRILPGHRGQVVAIAFDTTGQRLISSGWDRQVRVWDLHTGDLSATLVGCVLAGASDRIAVIQNDRLRIWQFASVNVLRILRTGEANCSQQPTFTPDGRHLVASGPGGACLIDLASGAPLQLDTRESRRPSASGNRVISNIEGKVIEWTLPQPGPASQPAAPLTTPPPHRTIPLGQPINDAVLSPDGRLIIACAAGKLCIHDADTGKLLRSATLGRGIESPAISPDARCVFLGNWKGSPNTACLVDLDSLKPLARFDGASVAGAFSSDSSRLAVCTPTNLELWTLNPLAKKWSIPRQTGQELAVRPAFSPDGRLLATCASMYDAQIHSAESGELLLRFPNPDLYMIGDLEFSRDGRNLAAATSSSIIQLWDIEAIRRELSTLRLQW